MANQVKTAFVLVALSAASAIGLAAPASADEASYLQAVAPRYAYLSESQLLDAGHQVCAAARSGVPGSDNAIALSKSLGISIPAAAAIVTASVGHLGC